MDAETRQNYGILFYVRFRDDLLVITTAGPDLLDEFLEELRGRSKHFKLKVDASSPYRVEMLDLMLTKSGQLTDNHWWRSGVPDIGIHVKKTCQKVPLCDTSNHHPSLHRAWPSGRLQHFKRLCSSLKLKNKACIDFVDMIRKHLPYHTWLQTRDQTLDLTRAVTGL